MRKHTIAVQPKTKVKTASFDQDFVDVMAGVGSSRFVGSAVGRASIGCVRRINDESWREIIMLGDGRISYCTRRSGAAKGGKESWGQGSVRQCADDVYAIAVVKNIAWENSKVLEKNYEERVMKIYHEDISRVTPRWGMNLKMTPVY
jgi:hypothetical protein